MVRQTCRSIVLGLLFAFAGLLLFAAAPIGSNPPGEKLSPEVQAQILALTQEKRSRTPAQMKIDSQLLYKLRQTRHEAIMEKVPYLETDVVVDNQGMTVVDFSAQATPGLLRKLEKLGAEIIAAPKDYPGIRASVPLARLEEFAALHDVLFITAKQEAELQGGIKAHPVACPRDEGVEMDAPKSGVASNGSGIPAKTGQGSVTTEGDYTHMANWARNTFHINGTGVKIGVLSNGVDGLSLSQASGDLGTVTVVPGQAGSGSEGTAMLEIIHDVAPGAQLYFATAFNGIASFAQNIHDLRFTYGCDIIVDDVSYFVESPFQNGQAPSVVAQYNSGIVIQAVNDVTADGALYFSSAGNSQNFDVGGSTYAGFAGVWEGDFVDGGPITTGPLAGQGNVHLFTGGYSYDPITALGNSIYLKWSDPLGNSSNDYDLYRLNTSGTGVYSASANPQLGVGYDPVEAVSAGSTLGARLVIVKYSGAGRYLHLNTNRGSLNIATPGIVYGHNAAKNTVTCAAAAAFGAFSSGVYNRPGPYPNPYNSSQLVEAFSSDGPRRIFYNADSTPITPGNVSSTGGQLLQKPDVTAADGVSVTGVGGFGSPFYGTSAAAPHAAAIAGLVKSANLSLTGPQILNKMKSTAIDIMALGWDRDSGVGIVMAYPAVQATGISGTADIELGAISATELVGNGDGFIDAGESASMTIQLKNYGVVDATGVSAKLTSSTPGVYPFFLPVAYPNIPATNGQQNNSRPFQFALAPWASCPLVIDFTLTVTYSGGGSPKVLHFTLPTPGTIGISGTLGTVASGNGYTATTGTQTGRISRNGSATTCSSTFPKAWPGFGATTGSRLYDAYTFSTCPSNAGGCITVTMSGANAINLYHAAYLGSFDPTNIQTNYYADPGVSSASTTYSFTLPSGVQTFVLVVHEVTPGASAGTPYTLSVSGACISTCPGPPMPKSFLDDTKRSSFCVYPNGYYDWSILKGAGAVSTYSGIVQILNGGTLFTSYTGDPNSVYLTYDVLKAKANGYFYGGGFYSPLVDTNTKNDPACGVLRAP